MGDLDAVFDVAAAGPRLLVRPTVGVGMVHQVAERGQDRSQRARVVGDRARVEPALVAQLHRLLVDRPPAVAHEQDGRAPADSPGSGAKRRR